MNKKKIFAWALYDFANSFVSIAFFLYFSQWLVIDRGASDLWFNILLALSSILYLLVGPVLGSIADKTGNKITGMRLTTVITLLLYLATGIIAIAASRHIVIASILFTVASATYLLSFIYYNSFLSELAPREKQGLVSGWGLFGNYLGQISAVLVALPFARGSMTLFGEPGRAQAFIPACILFIIFALPMLLLFKKEPERRIDIRIAEEYRSAWSSFIHIFKIPYLGLFFAAYFFFNDAVLTAANNFPIYMDRVFGAGDDIKSYILAGIMITSAIGCPIAGWVADRFGFKRTLIGILLGWIAIFPLLACAQTIPMIVGITIVMGLWFGAAWTVTRAIVLRLTPPQDLNRSYTYFTLMERFATLIGPISWGLIVMYGPVTHALNYRLAAGAMTLFILIGLLIVRKLPKELT
jgi:UMF1 family MFS transporter